ncbi:hypothetical protein Ocin01_08716 [Orchesella cincta]|uniref:Uncharacterized protein n=1 Tax=Orchesella cincta TaxID=48709 RepID=A0A1D2MYT2_ORCCI|nr:hypothetical protein Ocin01_08716 [Orchesella cincta]
MSFANTYGIRIIAGVSTLSAIALLLVNGFVFIVRLEDLKSKFSSSGVPNTTSDISQQETYQQLLSDMTTMWAKYRSILVSSSMLALLAALLQIIFSGFVILADSRSLQLYTRKWIIVHFILIFVMIIVLIELLVLTEDSGDKKTWENQILTLSKFLKHERPYNDYSGLFRFLHVGQTHIYASLGTNFPIVSILMGILIYFMRNQQGDYESYE